MVESKEFNERIGIGNDRIQIDGCWDLTQWSRLRPIRMANDMDWSAEDDADDDQERRQRDPKWIPPSTGLQMWRQNVL